MLLPLSCCSRCCCSCCLLSVLCCCHCCLCSGCLYSSLSRQGVVVTLTLTTLLLSLSLPLLLNFVTTRPRTYLNLLSGCLSHHSPFSPPSRRVCCCQHKIVKNNLKINSLHLRALRITSRSQSQSWSWSTLAPHIRSWHY